MAGVNEFLDRVNEFEVLNIPVGAGMYYKAAEQLARFVTDLIEHVVSVPPIVSGGIAAYLLRHPKVEEFLGRYGSYYASMAAAGQAVDSQIGISAMVGSALSKISGKLPQISVSTQPQQKSLSGVEGGDLGQLPEPSNDDADIYEEYMKQSKIEGL